jgi:ubiquinol-cytochrome c reductase iron-sulfur subunit
MSDLPPPRRPYVEGEEIPPDARPLSVEDDPTGVEIPASPGAELLVACLLVAAGLAGLGFVAAYVLSRSTQLYGATLGGALLLLAAALVVAGKRIVPQEVVIEPRHPLDHPEEERKTAELVRYAGAGVTRGRALKLAAGFSLAGIFAAVVSAAASFGPWIGSQSVADPWRRGRQLVDEHGVAIRADDLDIGSFKTAFPRRYSAEKLGAPIILVRIDPAEIRLPRRRRGWAPQGILAYSKICTHAGCAVAMMRYPLFQAHVPGPALVCPCHYSTFDVATGGTVLFGPAGRPLPQLPLAIAADGTLRAAGPLSADVGPAWFGVKRG